MSRFERFDRRGSSDCDPVAILGAAQDITAPRSSHLKLCRVVSSCCPRGCLSFQHFLLASSPSFFFLSFVIAFAYFLLCSKLAQNVRRVRFAFWKPRRRVTLSLVVRPSFRRDAEFQRVVENYCLTIHMESLNGAMPRVSVARFPNVSRVPPFLASLLQSGRGWR